MSFVIGTKFTEKFCRCRHCDSFHPGCDNNEHYDKEIPSYANRPSDPDIGRDIYYVKLTKMEIT